MKISSGLYYRNIRSETTKTTQLQKTSVQLQWNTIFKWFCPLFLRVALFFITQFFLLFATFCFCGMTKIGPLSRDPVSWEVASPMTVRCVSLRAAVSFPHHYNIGWSGIRTRYVLSLPSKTNITEEWQRVAKINRRALIYLVRGTPFHGAVLNIRMCQDRNYKMFALVYENCSRKTVKNVDFLRYELPNNLRLLTWDI